MRNLLDIIVYLIQYVVIFKYVKGGNNEFCRQE